MNRPSAGTDVVCQISRNSTKTAKNGSVASATAPIRRMIGCRVSAIQTASAITTMAPAWIV